MERKRGRGKSRERGKERESKVEDTERIVLKQTDGPFSLISTSYSYKKRKREEEKKALLFLFIPFPFLSFLPSSCLYRALFVLLLLFISLDSPQLKYS